ncbi:Ran GAP Rna1 [Thecaphora frezii]
MSDSKSFSLVGQNLKLDSKTDIQPHLDAIAAIKDLEEIHLGGNTLGVEACQALAEVLRTKKTLKVADFADIFTGRLITEIPDALRALCDALQDNENLVELNLSDNAFGGRSAEPMVNFLKHNHHFSVLKLNNNGLGVTGGTIVAEALIAAAVELKSKGLSSNLRTVVCGRNRLENGSAPVWAKAFAAHGGLVEVRMFQNGIRMEGIEAISQGLASCPNLEVLDLQDNTATVRGSRAIAACLPKWPKLKTLNLSDCLLKPKGGALVFGALAKGGNTELETIQVQYCDLDRKALDTLGGAIEVHLQKLTKLEINGNWADEDDECITKIKDALAKWEHAEALDELDEMDPEGEDEEEDEEAEAEEDENEDEPAPNPYKEAAIAGTGAAVVSEAAPNETEAVVANMTSTREDDTDKLAQSLNQTKIADQENAAAPAVPAAPANTDAAPTEETSAVVAPVDDAPAETAETNTATEAVTAAPTADAAPEQTGTEPIEAQTAAAAPAPAAVEAPASEKAAPTAIEASKSEAPAPVAVEAPVGETAVAVAAAAAAPTSEAAASVPETSTPAAPEAEAAAPANTEATKATTSAPESQATTSQEPGTKREKKDKKGTIKNLFSTIRRKLA